MTTGRSIHDWTPTYDKAVLAALSAHGIDLDTVNLRPDDVWTVTLPDGWIAFASEPSDTGGADWWTATSYDADDNDALIYEGTSLDELASALARHSRPAELD